MYVSKNVIILKFTKTIIIGKRKFYLNLPEVIKQILRLFFIYPLEISLSCDVSKYYASKTIAQDTF